MRDVIPEAVSVFNFDYHARLVNIIITILGFICNVLHFSVLVQKSLRNSPVFIMMLVTCLADLFYLISTLVNDVKYLLDFNRPDFCLGYDTYNGSILTIIIMSVASFTMLISQWLAVLMAFFRAISIKFSMSSWSESLSRPRTAKITSGILIGISLTYTFIWTISKYSPTPKKPDFYCLFSSYKGPNTPVYTLLNSDSKIGVILLFTLLDGIQMLFQLILFTFSTIFLAKFIRETAKNKILKTREDRASERTEGLVLFTLMAFFVANFPMVLTNFLLPFVLNFNMIPYAIMMTTTIMTMLQTLNASTHGIICVLMSSKYREVAKTAFSPRNSGNSSSTVAPMANDVSIIRVESVN